MLRSMTGLTLLYHNFIEADNWHFLSLWSKTENDITRKVEGTDSQFEEVLGLLE